MKLIAHRGNTTGRQFERENSPQYIGEALLAGFDVEVDVRFVSGGELMLGHDFAQHSVSLELLMNPRVWCHAKDRHAFQTLLQMGAHCFWHQNDDYTLTSQGYVWTYPDVAPIAKSIIVSNERRAIPPGIAGVCSDQVASFVR